METDLTKEDNERLEAKFRERGLEIIPLKNRYAIKSMGMSYFYKDIIKQAGGRWQTVAYSYDPSFLVDDKILPCWTVPNKQMDLLLHKLKIEDRRLEALRNDEGVEQELLALCHSLSITMEPSTDDPGIYHFIGEKCRYYKQAFKPFGRVKRIEEPPKHVERNLTDQEIQEYAEGVVYWRWEIPELRLADLLKKLKEVMADRKAAHSDGFKNFHQHMVEEQRRYPDYLAIRNVVNDMGEQFEEEIKQADFKPSGKVYASQDYDVAIIPAFTGTTQHAVHRPLFKIPRGVPEAVPIAKKYVDQLNKMVVRIERHGKDTKPKTTVVELKPGEAMPKNKIVDNYEWTTYTNLQAQMKTIHD